jgi:F-type H+-transporting ATPase subunit b
MKRNSLILPGLCASGLVLFFAALAHGAQQEGAGTAEHPADVIFLWIHFLIIAGLAYWLLKKVLPPVIRTNADKISAAISKAAAAKLEAERQLKDAEAKLATLEQEVAHFREQAQKDAAAELQRLRGMIKVDIDKVIAAAQAEIEAAERSARLELKALAAKLAVDRAESLVAQQMTPAVQESMINNFVQSLQGRPN